MKVLILICCSLLVGCASWGETKQCSVGVMFFGPIPIPTVGCELIFEEEDDDDDETED